MAEASFYYETASRGLGQELLDDLQRMVDTLHEHLFVDRRRAP